MTQQFQRKPDWLKGKAAVGENRKIVTDLLKKLNLNTVCNEASCPNRAECFGNKTAAFMILGSRCTRNCTFCNVTKESPQAVDPHEPEHVAQAVREMGLAHVVVTSVTRDDLADGGAEQFAKTIRAIKNNSAKTVIEVLIPDFQGSIDALRIVTDAHPHIINHNLETVPRLYPEVRPMADCKQSLTLLKNVKQLDGSIHTKSGIMLGLGETKEEVLDLLRQLREAECEILTIGQYLPPSKQHHPLIEYVHPDQFEEYRIAAEEMGFSYVASSPLVRSSYQADKAIRSFGTQSEDGESEGNDGISI
ncbi:MAG: lipoyl synthase [Anaerofustis sp.]